MLSEVQLSLDVNVQEADSLICLILVSALSSDVFHFIFGETLHFKFLLML